MKQFSNVVAKIKNSDGKFESIPALRGMSSYEVAKEAGFTGTEEEWLTFMFDDGWVAKFQELKANKADWTSVYTKDETLSEDVKTAFGLPDNCIPNDVFRKLSKREPWNVDKNIGLINMYPGEREYNLPVGDDDTGVITEDIPMINSGEIYLSFSCSVNYQHQGAIQSVEILRNGEIIKTLYEDPDAVVGGSVTTGLILLSVNRDDVIRIRLNYEPTMVSKAWIRGLNLYANIETPYTYIYPILADITIPDDE